MFPSYYFNAQLYELPCIIFNSIHIHFSDEWLCLGLEFVTYVSNDDVMCLSLVFGWVKYLNCYIKRGDVKYIQ